VWEDYLSTEISIALPDRGWIGALDAVATLKPPIHVLTAWNPGFRRLGLEENRGRNRRLLERLSAQDVVIHPAVGASPDGSHYEESYAVVGLQRTVAIELGRELEQAAIFELTYTQQSVFGCDNGREVSRALRFRRGRHSRFPSDGR
jgi:Protein of unknown function (DUF3293)